MRHCILIDVVKIACAIVLAIVLVDAWYKYSVAKKGLADLVVQEQALKERIAAAKQARASKAE